MLIGEQGTRSAEAARCRSLSRLLPEVTTRIAEVGQQINLKAFGFSGFPGIHPIVGPFNILEQYSYQDARDVVVLAVVNL